MTAIKHIEGTHLTATNKRHLAYILGQGWTAGNTKALVYRLAPMPGEAGRWRYTITKQERDEWGRKVKRVSRGVLEVMQ